MDYKEHYKTILKDEETEIKNKIKNFKKNGETDLINYQRLLDKQKELKEKQTKFEKEEQETIKKGNIKNYIVAFKEVLNGFISKYKDKPEYVKLFNIFLTNGNISVIDETTKDEEINLNIDELIFDLFFYEYNSKNTIKFIDKNTINVYQDNEQVKSLYEVLDNKSLNTNMFFYLLNDEYNEGKLKYLTDIQKANEFYIIKFIDIIDKTQQTESTDKIKQEKIILTVSETENNKKCIIANNNNNNKNMKILGEYKI